MHLMPAEQMALKLALNYGELEDHLADNYRSQVLKQDKQLY